MMMGGAFNAMDAMKLLPLYASMLQVSQSAAVMLLTAIWQGLAIAACLLLCLRLAPRIPASSRYAILASGFLAILILQFLPVASRLFAHRGQEGGAAAGAGMPAPWLMVDARWSLLLTALWLGASLWRMIDLGGHALRLRRLWKDATQLEVGHPMVSALPRLAGRRALQVCATTELEKPSVIGFLAPRILIPAWLLERMTAQELEQIVLHETEHLLRGDDWTNLLQKLSLAIFPLHLPLLWLERRLCLEREMACDEGVVQRTRAPRAYAACLASLAERGLERRAQALSLGAWHRRPELARRVQRILARKPALRPTAARGLAAVLVCGLAAGSVELARCPQMVGFVNEAARPASLSNARNTAASQPVVERSGADSAGDRVMRPDMRAVVSRSGRDAQPRMREVAALMPSDGRASAERELFQSRPLSSGSERHGRPHAVLAAALSAEPAFGGESGEDSKAGTAAVPETEGWIVLTAWEQTGASPEEANTGSPGDGTIGYGSEVQQSSLRQSEGAESGVTVTQLVFRVTQRATRPGERSEASQSGQPSQPAIVPVRGGWLIFRL